MDQKPLIEGLDTMTRLWADVEERFATEMCLVTGCWVPFNISDGVPAHLGIVRVKGEWRICVSSQGNDSIPVRNCSILAQTQAAPHLAALVEAVERSNREMIARIDEAIGHLRRFLAKP